MNCWDIGPNELIIEAIRLVNEEEPLGVELPRLHEKVIRELDGCSDLMVVEGSWSPIVQKAIQIIIDSELGYVDENGRLHVSEAARVLAA